MSLLPTEEDKAQSRGYAEGLADGKKERYAKLRKELLGKYTTQEIVDELRKREGVKCTITEPLDYYWITIMAEGDATDKIKGVGEATILTVKR